MGIPIRSPRPPCKLGPHARCACEWSRHEWHDELLRLEEKGVEGVAGLVSAWAAERLDGSADAVGSSEFEAFVAAHHWIDPGVMYRLAHSLSETFDRYRSEGARTRTAFEYEVALVRSKAATLRAEGAVALADNLDEGIGEIVTWIEGRQTA